MEKEECEYLQVDYDDDTWECSKCGCYWCLSDGTPIDNNMNYCPECGAKIIKQYFFEDWHKDE